MVEKRKCERIKSNGEQCKMAPIKGENFCIAHSKSEYATNRRKKRGVPTPDKMIRIFNAQFYEVSNDRQMSVSEKARLLLSIANKIDEYRKVLSETKDERSAVADKAKNGDSFENKINRAKQRVEGGTTDS